MRILTVRQPWAWAIIHGGKNIENRVRNIAGDYRGPVAIHGSLSLDLSGFAHPELHASWEQKRDADELHGGWGDRYRGAIIGVVDLVDAHVARAAASGRLVDWAEHTKPGELCSPWSEWDSHHLVLSNPRALTEPIPYRGALGLRRLGDETTASILAQIGES